MKPIKVSLVLGDDNFIFNITDEDEIPTIAEEFCKENDLNEEC
jgi:hypothetical protein